MTSNALVLGVDGGGTQTRAQVATLEGNVLGTGQGGPSNIAALSPEDALQSVLTAAEQALAQVGAQPADVRSVCAGVAGTSYTARRAMLLASLQAYFPLAQILVVPDFAIALAGATEGQPGVIVVAGTGSVAYGENESGQSHRTGGYGYLLDDSGSGYGVGRAVLAAILRAADGTGAPTALTARVLETLGLSSPAEIVPGVYGGAIDRVTIASLSRVVGLIAEEDTVAQGILMRAGGALAQLAHGVTSVVFPAQDVPFSVATVGGLWNAGPILKDVFARSFARFAPHAKLIEVVSSPVAGAVLRAIALCSSQR